MNIILFTNSRNVSAVLPQVFFKASISKYLFRSYVHYFGIIIKEVQVGKDQEKAQSEKDSHSKNRGGKKPN